jgi:hypothetical protein
MKHLALVCWMALAAAACDGGPNRPSPVPSPSPAVPSAPPPAPPAAPAVLVVDGEVEIEGAVPEEEDRRFVLIAPAGGTLVIVLTWDSSAGILLRLKINGDDVPEGCCTWDSPVSARRQVIQDQQVQVDVNLAGNVWGYLRGHSVVIGPGPRSATAGGMPFVLKARVEDEAR